jgi:hypothetical protein
VLFHRRPLNGIQEIDINPVMVFSDGAQAVDVRVILKKQDLET